MSRPAPAAVPIHYPSSDGKPMAENDAQRNAILYGIGALKRHFRDRRNVYVSGDLLIYYEEGNPRVSIAPDVFVVFGVEKRERLNYKLWEEGRAPSFVLEVASPSTWRDDLGRKRSVYARLGGARVVLAVRPDRRLPAGAPAGGAVDAVGLRPSTGVDSAGRRPDAPQRNAGSGFAGGGRGGEMRFRDPATGDDPAQPRGRKPRAVWRRKPALPAAETRAGGRGRRTRATESAARLAAEARASSRRRRGPAAAEARAAELEGAHSQAVRLTLAPYGFVAVSLHYLCLTQGASAPKRLSGSAFRPHPLRSMTLRLRTSLRYVLRRKLLALVAPCHAGADCARVLTPLVPARAMRLG